MAINSLSSMGASSYGLSGLVSGMNTEDIVEKLLTGTQAKIDSAGQKKTALQYKQTMYREVMTKLKALQSSFLSFTSGTNLLSNSFFNTMSAAVVPPSGLAAAFSVTASTDAAVGTSTMQYVKQLATARTAKTTKDASGAVSGVMDTAVANRLLASHTGSDATLHISVGNKTVNFAEAAILFGGKNQSEVASIINQKFIDEGVSATARFENNKLTITAEDDEAFITVNAGKANNSTLGMRMFGSGIATLSGQGKLAASIDSNAYLPSFEVNLDGRQQTIRVDLGLLKQYAATGSAADGENLVDDISQKLKNVFGAGVSALYQNGKITFKEGVKSQKFTITGSSEMMGTMGLETGISNKLNTNMAIKELNFSQELQGSRFTFKINDVEFSYDKNAALSTIINDVNTSSAGVKISYVESEDRFVLQSAETGAGSREFEIEQSQGNLMSVLFGAKGGEGAVGAGLVMDMTGAAADASEYAYGGTFTFNVNGRDYRFTVDRRANNMQYDAATFAKSMNDAFLDTFGYNADGTQKVQFKESGGVFTVHTNDPDITIKAAKYDRDNNTSLLGFTEGQSTLATDGGISIGSLGINFGTSGSITVKLDGYSDIVINAADLDSSLSLDGLAATVNQKIKEGMDAQDAAASRPARTSYPTVEYDAKNAAFRVLGVDIPMEIVIDGGTDTDKLFGQNTIKTGTPADAAYMPASTDGKNAIFMLNGYEMERASNTFTVDGLTYTLHSTTHKDKQNPVDGQYEAPTQVTVSRDTKKIVDGMTDFLKQYNETMDYLYGLTQAEATYKSYAPLTEKQKADMSEREIELWEEKSKEGLLRGDAGVERIIQTVRKLMYSKPENSSIAIYNLGITTSFYTSDGNLNPSSTDNLRAAIEADPEAVRSLFAGDGGLMEQLNSAINEAVSSSYGQPGYITAVAGSNGLDTSSRIYKQITEIDDQLVTLESRYWAEYNRYWKQFNNMEKVIQQMNSQSSWLSQLSTGA